MAATATEGRGVYKAGVIRRALMVVVKRRVVKRLLAWWTGLTYSRTPAWCLRKIELISHSISASG